MTCCFSPPAALAQLPPETQPDIPIDAGTAARILLKVSSAVREAYVFPDKADGIAKAIEAHHAAEYGTFRSARTLLDRMNADLLNASHDRHLRVIYSARGLPPPKGDAVPETPEERATRLAQDAAQNFGFVRVEILPGNIGYLDVRRFADPGDGGETAVAAMGFVSHAKALIFDLRNNHGGDPGMIALVLSYLFDSPTHLNDIYWRPDGSTGQFWTSGFVAGHRFTGDVYVLTSAETFSAGEEFSYDLQTLKRATIVGETTGGGAHPITIHRVDDHFVVLVPSGRAINPITHTNWEGTGVSPDVRTTASRALLTAQLSALTKLHAEEGLIASVRKELDAVK
jgi:hypothetical protein